MADPTKPQTSGPKWIWVAVIVALAFVAITVMFNPSGDRDGSVQDPIVMDDPGEGRGVGQTPDPEIDTGPAPEPFAPGGEPEQ